jgi:hypothetical protein
MSEGTPDPRKSRGNVAQVLGALGCSGALAGVAVVMRGMGGSYSEGDAAGTTGLCLGLASFVLSLVATLVAALALRKPAVTPAGTGTAKRGLAAGLLGLVLAGGLVALSLLALVVNFAAV